jgi:AraC family transcriptional regulator, regulatory protein of adaptative response / DNA-3-methyladenine glycosylase II
LRIALPADFDLDWALGFLAARTVPSLEEMRDGEYRRSLWYEEAPVVLSLRRIETRGAAFEVRTAPPLVPATARRLVVRLFDLDADLGSFHALAAADPVLCDLVPRRPGIRLPQLLDPFEGICRAILGQQVSVTAASTMVDRLTRLLGGPAPLLDASRFLSFPRPQALAAAGPDALAKTGLTRAKASALHTVATAAAEGRLDFERLRSGTAEESHTALVALPGIGPWTASYVRMRTLGDRDAFPASDLGVVKALRALLPQGDRLTVPEIVSLGESWRPWRAYATLHLWNSLSP